MIDEIKNHRSVRRFKSTPIADDVMQQILEAASRGSNTGNMQIYSVVVTRSADLKKQLCERCHFSQAMVAQAPVVLTFCADIRRFNHWCRLRNAEPVGFDNFLTFYTASVDAVIAAQNAALQAEASGLGVCFLGTTNYLAEPIIDVLGLPTGVMPVTTLVIGYPEQLPQLTDRLPLRAVVHDEVYRDFSDEEINQLYADLESTEASRQLVEQNQTDNLAQIFTRYRYPQKSNVEFSQALLKALRRQGFMNNDL